MMQYFKNVLLWNIRELIKNEDGGYSLLRLPHEVEKNMLEQGRLMNQTAIGVEFRFIPKGKAKFYLKSKDPQMTRAYLYRGVVQAEWQQSYFTISNEKITTIEINPFKEVDAQVEWLNHERKSPFSSRLYRLVFDYTSFELFDIEGEFLQIEEKDMPEKRYLSYGSSITSASLTYLQNLSYPYLVANHIGYDLINIGFPGSCRLEKEVAEFIAKSHDFDIATIELGINVIAEWDEAMFQNKVHEFLNVALATHEKETFFITDIMSYFNECCSAISVEKVENYRSIVKEEVEKIKRQNVFYIRGDALLKSCKYLCADLVHPSLEGHQEIYQNFIALILNKL